MFLEILKLAKVFAHNFPDEIGRVGEYIMKASDCGLPPKACEGKNVFLRSIVGDVRRELPAYGPMINNVS